MFLPAERGAARPWSCAPPLDGLAARASSSSSSLMTPEGVSPGASASGDAEAAHVDNFSKFPVAAATSASSAGAANMQCGGICSGVAAHDEGCAREISPARRVGRGVGAVRHAFAPTRGATTGRARACGVR